MKYEYTVEVYTKNGKQQWIKKQFKDSKFWYVLRERKSLSQSSIVNTFRLKKEAREFLKKRD